MIFPYVIHVTLNGPFLWDHGSKLLPGDVSFPASTPSRSGVRTGEGTEEKNGSAKGALATVEVEPINGVPLERLVDSMDWVKGKSTGNHGFNHQI